MLITLLFLFLALLFFLVLTEVITVTVAYDDYAVIEISLMIFALKLTFCQKDKKRNKKKSKKTDSPFWGSFMSSAAKRSDITIKRLNVKIPAAEPQINALRFGVYTSALSSILALIKNNTRNFTVGNINTEYSEHNKPEIAFDAQIKISALNLLICLIGYGFEIASRKLFKKRGINRGRKQNE